MGAFLHQSGHLRRVRRSSALSANQRQVGGQHYKALQPEPWDVIASWECDYFVGSAIKYLARCRLKNNTVEDLRKAQHFIEKAIEIELSIKERNE